MSLLSTILAGVNPDSAPISCRRHQGLVCCIYSEKNKQRTNTKPYWSDPYGPHKW